MNASKLLVVVITLQSLILVNGIGGDRSILPEAKAQIPDAGAQRLQVIDQLKEINGKMDRLMDVLASGDLQVRVAKDDEKK